MFLIGLFLIMVTFLGFGAAIHITPQGRSLLSLDGPIFPLKNPAIVSVPIGFLATFVCTVLFRNRREEEMFEELYVRQITGYGVAKAVEH